MNCGAASRQRGMRQLRWSSISSRTLGARAATTSGPWMGYFFRMASMLSGISSDSEDKSWDNLAIVLEVVGNWAQGFVEVHFLTRELVTKGMNGSALAIPAG